MEPHADSTALTLLRSATAQAHRDLEAQIDIPKVCADRLSYERLLCGFFGFMEPMENLLQAIPGWEERGFHWRERAKTGLLREDLQELRYAATLDRIPRCSDLPQPTTLAQAFGCAYVLEGSTLGGRQIVKILAQSDVPPDARHYFSSYGEDVGLRWREFLSMLGHFNTGEAEAMVPLAVETFEKLGAWLGAWLDRPR